MTPVLPPCSRSAHDQNVPARRSQWDQHGSHSKRDKQASLEDGMGNLGVLLLAERAPSEGPRSTRAIEDRPGRPMKRDTS